MNRDKKEKKDKESKAAVVDNKKKTAEELDQLREEVKLAKEQYLRILAEVENTQKRLAREKEESIKFASESVVRDLIPIIDSLDQALRAVDKQHDPKSVIQGVQMIYQQILGLLYGEGVQRIETIGEVFDPNMHEAVAQVDAQNDQEDGEIIEEVHVGYKMHGRVIRPALVKVAKKAADSAVGGSASGGSTQQTADGNEVLKSEKSELDVEKENLSE